MRKLFTIITFRCDQIKKDAVQSATLKNYDEAIYGLMQVPDVCDCSEECQDLMIDYSNKKNQL